MGDTQRFEFGDFRKFDRKKLRPSLLPLRAIRKALIVLEHGAQKYGPDNWKDCDDLDRYYNACLGHIFAWKEGIKYDKDTGFSHLAHALCSLLFMVALEDGEDGKSPETGSWRDVLISGTKREVLDPAVESPLKAEIVEAVKKIRLAKEKK